MSKYAPLKQYATQLGCSYFENEPLSEHTTFKIGGPADIFLSPPSKTVLQSLLEACKKWELPTLVMGSGSNLLVSDLGFRGVVLHVGGGFAELELEGAFEIRCGAGVKLSRLCNFALEHSLSGLEFAWGIPGSAGGAAYMNAGAYDGEMSQVILRCEHVSLNGEAGSRTGEEMNLSYRHSVYAETGDVITSVLYKLTPGDPEEIREKTDDLMNRRRAKQPVELPSAGRVFKRPPGKYAGTLIEECGLKGERIGDAMVSEKHAGFIVNMGDATCTDVRLLIEKIKEKVFLKTGVRLECEIKMIG